MTPPIRREAWRALLLGLCLLLPIRAWAGAGEDETVLLLTSPRVGEMKNLQALAAKGWLTGTNLKVIGIHHAAEWTDYGSAHRWVARHGGRWIEIRAIDCELSADQVAGKNDCSQTFDDLFARADGIVFTGGPDIPPSLYGQKTRLTTVISDPPRHWFEISLLRHLLVGDPKSGRKPLLDGRPAFLVLGLCLGMQTLNVATGGTLWQDIPSQVYRLNTLEAYAKLPTDKRHRSVSAQLAPGTEVGWGHLHKVRFKPHRLSEILAPDGKPVTTFSLHHQAVHRIGLGLKVWATSLDGKVVEGLVHQKYPAVFGVQFHPEKRILTDPSLAYRASPGAEPKNHIAARIAKDDRAKAFLQRFWSLVSDLLATSRKARVSASLRSPAKEGRRFDWTLKRDGGLAEGLEGIGVRISYTLSQSGHPARFRDPEILVSYEVRWTRIYVGPICASAFQHASFPRTRPQALHLLPHDVEGPQPRVHPPGPQGKDPLSARLARRLPQELWPRAIRNPRLHPDVQPRPPQRLGQRGPIALLRPHAPGPLPLRHGLQQTPRPHWQGRQRPAQDQGG